MEIAAIAFLASIALAFVLLVRQRERVRPEDSDVVTKPRIPRNKQERILSKLEPLPEIPTVMDLVRQEVEETGVEKIPGHEGLSGPVMLKVFKRDQFVVESCTHEAYEFVIRDGVSPTDALEDDVQLFCSQCGNVAKPDNPEPAEEPTTEPAE